MQKRNNKRSIILPVLIIPVFFSGLFGSIWPCKQSAPTPATLEFWGVFDDSAAFAQLIAQFKSQYSYVTINYHKKNPATYEKELVDALAAGRGPDIFAIANTWLPKHGDKIFPADPSIFISKEYKETFVDVAANDFIANDRIYAAPLAVDTLALYYNKDLLNSAGIASPPRTWLEFNSAVEKLTIKDENNNITRAGAAIGTADNINRPMDILMALMLQSGANMVTSDHTTAVLDENLKLASGENIKPGDQSLIFYTNFANPAKSVYTWNSYQHYSMDAFVEGKAAMMLSYAYQLPVLKSRAPHLNFGITPLPQISASSDKKTSLANYWGLTVSKTTANSLYAWTFIKWLTNQENSKIYLEASRRPAARRDLIDWQKNDEELGSFAQQSLLARSWWQVDNVAIDEIFVDMINEVIKDRTAPADAVSAAAKQLSLLMGEYRRQKQ